jgi:replicative DNA helicase
MPNNVEAEEAVLGSILVDQGALVVVSDLLAPKDFNVERNGWIYEILLNLNDQGKGLDMVTVMDELERQGVLKEVGGSAYLTSLLNATPTSIHAEYYAGIVARTAGLRRVIETAGRIARLAFRDQGELSDVLDEAEAMMFEACRRNGKQGGPRSISEALGDYQDRLEAVCRNGHSADVVTTGLIDLDKLLDGLYKGDMVVLAGRPSMGKTSLALSIALHAARDCRKKVAMYSLEMSERQLVERLVAAEMGVDSRYLRKGILNEEEWSAYFQAEEALDQSPIFIDDTPALSVMELRSSARRLQAEHGLDLLIVDYMQLMRGDGRSENRQQEISHISRSIKALAKELDVPVLALSQLSRQCETRHDKRPILADLRESGAIEQDSDVVIFIYRDEEYNPDTEFPNLAELIVAKQRSGPTGVLSVYFKRAQCRFEDLTVSQPLGGMIPMNGRRPCG